MSMKVGINDAGRVQKQAPAQEAAASNLDNLRVAAQLIQGISTEAMGEMAKGMNSEERSDLASALAALAQAVEPGSVNASSTSGDEVVKSSTSAGDHLGRFKAWQLRRASTDYPDVRISMHEVRTRGDFMGYAVEAEGPRSSVEKLIKNEGLFTMSKPKVVQD